MRAVPRDPIPSDPLLAALLPAIHLATELVAALDRATDRRELGWPTLLVSGVLDDAARLHDALGSSLARISRTIQPEVLEAIGMTEPTAKTAKKKG